MPFLSHPIGYSKAVLFAGSILVSITLTSCAPAPSRSPDVYYDIALAPVVQTYGSTASLSVSPLSAQGVMSSRPLVIQSSSEPLSFTELRGHLWHVSPAQLLQSALAESLSAGSTDLIIGTSETISSPDFRAKLKVKQFSFRPGIDATLTLEAILRSASGDILYSGTLSATHPISDDTAAAAVRAYQHALQELSAELAGIISAAI